MKPRSSTHAAPRVEGSKRQRRSPEDARRSILEAAEELLLGGGPRAVTVRAVAKHVGLTDMGVNHHFGSREGLLEALLEQTAARLRTEIAALTSTWIREGARLGPLIELLSSFYKAGHTQLAVALHEAGWRNRGPALLEPVVSALHAERLRRLGPRTDVEETRLAVAAMHQALALDPAFGAEFRRSAGIRGRTAADPKMQREWWIETLSQRLGIPR
jgi:AcrR family transcriptional regulator